VRALLSVTTDLALNAEMDQEAQIDAIVVDGKERLQQWESKYNPAAAAPASATGPSDADLLSPASSVSAEQDAAAEKLKDLGNNLYKKAAYAAAVKAYTSAIEINRYNATYYSNRSAAYLTMGEHQNALQDAEMCRRLKPDWTKGCYRLGAARLALGLYEDAAVAAFEGCKLDDKNLELKTLLQTCVKKGQEAHKKQLADAAATATK
jgi:tetratricopeptide (TPR) repeat protein